MKRSRTTLAALTVILMAAVPLSAANDVPRTSDGKPDLSGNYDVSTLTPMQRPTELGEKMSLTDEEAAEVAALEARRMAERRHGATCKETRKDSPGRSGMKPWVTPPFSFRRVLEPSGLAMRYQT